MDVTGKVAIVTGAASGLGRATAVRLAQDGARVAVVDIDADALAVVASEIGALAVSGDVADAAAAEAGVARIERELGTPHVLVTCAGIAPGMRIVGRDGPASLADFERVVRINLFGTFNWLRVCADAMKDNAPSDDGERGVILNTASVAAWEGQVGHAAYSASKGGVAAMTLPAARELARFGIRVAAIAPGFFGTAMAAGMSEAVQESVLETIPFPRRFGRPEEYADMVMAMIHNPMVNGSVIRLDAALRMQAQ